MTKRVRGTGRSHRPGTRPTTERSLGARRRIVERPSQLEAAEIIAEDVIEERPAEAAEELSRVAHSAARHRTKPGSLLAARAATEYVYVAQDLRRIVGVSALLFGVLILLWLLVVMLKVVGLPFY